MSSYAIEFIITQYPEAVFATLAMSLYATLILVTVSAFLPIRMDGLVSVTPSSLGPIVSMGLLRSCSQNDSSAPIICTPRTIPAQYDFTDLSAHVDTKALEAGTPTAGEATVICIGFGLSLLLFVLPTLVGFCYLAERDSTKKLVWDVPWMRVVAWMALLATCLSLLILGHLYFMLHMVIEVFNGSQSKFIASHGPAWNQMVGGYTALAAATIIYIAMVYYQDKLPEKASDPPPRPESIHDPARDVPADRDQVPAEVEIVPDYRFYEDFGWVQGAGHGGSPVIIDNPWPHDDDPFRRTELNHLSIIRHSVDPNDVAAGANESFDNESPHPGSTPIHGPSTLNLKSPLSRFLGQGELGTDLTGTWEGPEETEETREKTTELLGDSFREVRGHSGYSGRDSGASGTRDAVSFAPVPVITTSAEEGNEEA